MSSPGQVIGAADLCISIAGWPATLCLDGCDPSTAARIRELYRDFLIPQQPAPLFVQVHVEPGPLFIPMDGVDGWQVRSAMRGGRLEFASHCEAGWVDWAAGRGSLLMRPQGDPENFLRVVYAWRCLEEDSLLLHACGVIRQGAGYVFFGPSGSGKTTVASLSADSTVLSDDMVVVRREDGRFRVYGVPFCGDSPEVGRTNAAAELVGLYTLTRDAEHGVRPVAPAEAVGRLAACAPFVMAQPENAARVVGICAELSARVPVRALHFRRDSGFWQVIDTVSGASGKAEL